MLKTFKGHTKLVTSVDIFSDNQKFASGSWDKTIKIWDMQGGKLLKTLEGHISSEYSCNFTGQPDNREWFFR